MSALLVPADDRRRCQRLDIALTAMALSDAIGGGFLDENVHVHLEGGAVTVYLDDDGHRRSLPPNRRAAELVARLGVVDRELFRTLIGDALVVGLESSGDDCDVPAGVIEAARRSGLLITSGSAADRRAEP